MSARRVLLVVLSGVLALGCAALLPAQTIKEWNAYQDIVRAQSPDERLYAITTFLNEYPESSYRVYVYPILAETAFTAQQYPKTMQAVDSFLSIPGATVLEQYQKGNPNVQESALDPTYYRMYVLYTFSVLQSFRENGPNADETARMAEERARQALEMHDRLYAGAQPPQGVSPEQFEKVKDQEEAAFHNILAFTAWRKKDYAAAAREYGELTKLTPDDPAINYRLGLANLQKQPAEQERGFWYLARAIALGIPKGDEIRDFLSKNIAAYQQAVPDCLKSQVDGLIASAKASAMPPADWTLVSGERVNAVRLDMSLKRILDDLQAGGETARVMYLAACGSEIGMDEGGQPDLYVKVLAIAENPDNLVTLQVAAGQEAADAGRANMEVRVTEPPDATKLKADDVVRVSGTISGYQNDSLFLLQLANGRVRAEDIPKTR